MKARWQLFAAIVGAVGLFPHFLAHAASSVQATVDASRSEPELFVFTNLGVPQWQPPLKEFKALYPWINVSIVDLGSEVFERFYAETSSGGRGADMIVSGGADNWLDLVNKKYLAAYKSIEDASLPDWSKPSPGLYTFAADPAVIIYNKKIIAEDAAPKSVHDIAKLVAAKPELKNKISVVSVAGQFGRAANWGWIEKNKDAWDVLTQLGQVSRPERTVGPVIEKVTTGEYAIGWLVSGAALADKLRNPAYSNIVGWSYIADGTPVIPRRMGIMTSAKSPHSAQLFTDYLLSRQGQEAIALGGGVPYRTDIQKAPSHGMTYESVVKGAGGEANIVREEMSETYIAQRKDFLDRWRTVFVQAK